MFLDLELADMANMRLIIQRSAGGWLGGAVKRKPLCSLTSGSWARPGALRR
jgi:hypothetical protein